MANNYKKRELIILKEETGERKEMKSINAAARFLESTFGNVQTAALYNGVVKGWRVYESPETLRKHIAELEAQLEFLEATNK